MYKNHTLTPRCFFFLPHILHNWFCTHISWHLVFVPVGGVASLYKVRKIANKLMVIAHLWLIVGGKQQNLLAKKKFRNPARTRMWQREKNPPFPIVQIIKMASFFSCRRIATVASLSLMRFYCVRLCAVCCVALRRVAYFLCSHQRCQRSGFMYIIIYFIFHYNIL